jgi:hypothetical protein
MKKLTAALACACALLAPGANATSFGVADDTGKFALDGGATFFTQVAGAGLGSNRMVVGWDPAEPAGSSDLLYVGRSLPASSLLGIKVVLAVYPVRAKAITESPDGSARFAAFLANLARTFPQVKDFIVGNEPNQPRFWQPQFNPDRSPASPAAYEQLLARAYDALKGVDPIINVAGVGVSPRGNDNPRALDNVSISPVRFIHELGRAYRSSGRTEPIMDQLSFHPYPNSPTDPLEKGYRWPKAGMANLDRIKQAVWDAFNGTGQPVFKEGGSSLASTAGRFLTLRLDEVGWQVGIVPSAAPYYHGNENVETTDEANQARIYGQLVRQVSCDPAVTDVLLFGLFDEPDLDRFQAGLIRADGSPRPSYDAVRSAIAETAGRCSGALSLWRHRLDVEGAAARFGRLSKPRSTALRSWSLSATAEEDARYVAGIYRLGPGRSVAKARFAVRRALAASAPKPVLTKRGVINAYYTPVVRFPARRLKPGRYVYGIRLAAKLNPARVNVFVSSPFRVGRSRRAN